MTKLFTRLRELEAKVSPGDWSIGPKRALYEVSDSYEKQKLEWHGVYSKFEALSVGTATAQIAVIPLDESTSENAAFIAEARNAISKLLAVIDLYEEALTKSCQCYAIDGVLHAKVIDGKMVPIESTPVKTNWVKCANHDALEKARAIADGEEIAGE